MSFNPVVNELSGVDPGIQAQYVRVAIYVRNAMTTVKWGEMWNGIKVKWSEIWNGVEYEMEWNMKWSEKWNGMRCEIEWNMKWNKTLNLSEIWNGIKVKCFEIWNERLNREEYEMEFNVEESVK